MRAGLAVAAMLSVLTSGCGTGSDSGPIDWWHQLEGGRIAEARPPPPNADAPYPNLASVPARPTATAAAVRARIASELQTDRRDAAYAANQPIIPPAPIRAAPPPPPAEGGIGASLAAATAGAPPPAAVPAAAAPVPARAAPTSVPSAMPTAIPSAQAAPTAPVGAVPMPAIPSAPPPAPRLPGVAGVTAPTQFRPAPPPAAAPPAVVVPGAPAGIAFQPRSAVLPEAAPATLRQLAGTRGDRDILVVGYGDSTAADPAVQAASLQLAFARARSIATILAQAGVQPGAILLSAQARGRGGVARIAE